MNALKPHPYSGDNLETFERIRSRGFRPNEMEEDYEVTRIENTSAEERTVSLPILRRSIIASDVRPLKTMTAEVLQETNSDDEEVEICHDLGLTLASPQVTQNIYRNCYPIWDQYAATRRLSKHAKQSERRANRLHPRVFTQLGEVGVYGSKKPGDKKFIGAEIVPGTDEGVLGEERVSYIRRIVGGIEKIEKLYMHEDGIHLSLAHTDSLKKANEIAAKFNETGAVKGKWVTLDNLLVYNETFEIGIGEGTIIL